jgi:NTP pyrophosphatase (non-canonical NTP hydrolase)
MKQAMTITELCNRAHNNAAEHGFWDEPRDFATMMMLIVTECAEAIEADRHNDDAMMREEIADIAIRLGDLCGGLGINLEAEIQRKMAINEARPRLHYGWRYMN